MSYLDDPDDDFFGEPGEVSDDVDYSDEDDPLAFIGDDDDDRS